MTRDSAIMFAKHRRRRLLKALVLTIAVAFFAVLGVASCVFSEDHPRHVLKSLRVDKVGNEVLLHNTSGASMTDDISNRGVSASERGSKAKRKPNTMDSIKPVVWVHIPKTGTSFLTTLVFSLCPRWSNDWQVDTKRRIPSNFKGHDLTVECPGGFDAKYRSPSQFGHLGILGEDFYQQRKGKFVGMFRKPELRMLSAWYHDPGPWGDIHATNLTRYASSPEHQGCMVKSLTRGRKYPCHGPGATFNETKLAIRRLQEGFAFVGLTDFWDLSICLWHAMFDVGPIFRDELHNSRPGKVSSAEKQASLAVIRKFPDNADEAVFAMAETIFWNNVKLFGLTTETCQLTVAEAAERTNQR